MNDRTQTQINGIGRLGESLAHPDAVAPDARPGDHDDPGRPGITITLDWLDAISVILAEVTDRVVAGEADVDELAAAVRSVVAGATYSAHRADTVTVRLDRPDLPGDVAHYMAQVLEVPVAELMERAVAAGSKYL